MLPSAADLSATLKRRVGIGVGTEYLLIHTFELLN